MADPNGPFEPALDELRRYCNVGYARGACVRFPLTAEGPDAVRFSLTSDRGSTIELTYILEKDYGPLRHGPLVWDSAAHGFTTSVSPTLEAQARRFIESYLKRRVHS